MRAFLGFLSLVLAFTLATWVLGWLAVPVVAFAFGATAARSRVPLESLVAALAAWLVLLGVQAARGPVDHVAHVLGGIVGVPAWSIVLVSLVFGSALAWSAAVLGRVFSSASISSRRSS